MKARDLIKPNEKVLVIFTKDKESWKIADNYTGYSASWKTNPTKRSIDRVILYTRDTETNENTIYIGSYAGCKPDPLFITDQEAHKPRYIVYFEHTTICGS